MNNVNHPTHYNSGGIECIAGIKASMSRDAYCGFLKGNILKYIWRYEHKNGIEDLRKAKVYLDWLIAEQTERTEHQLDDSVFLMSNGREK